MTASVYCLCQFFQNISLTTMPRWRGAKKQIHNREPIISGKVEKRTEDVLSVKSFAYTFCAGTLLLKIRLSSSPSLLLPDKCMDTHRYLSFATVLSLSGGEATHSEVFH